MTVSGRVEEAVRQVRSRSSLVADVAIVLGSGMGAFARGVERATRVPFAVLPHMPAPSVPGHAGELILGAIAGVPCLVVSGRLHLYEGLTAEQVALPIRIASGLGARVALFTNAAGAVNVSFRPGELMLVTDHLNLTGANPLAGPPDPGLGERFIDMTGAYDPELLALAEKAAWKAGVAVRKGVYGAFAGPSYETPAEIRMARALGADAVGMSTVLEVLAARQRGLRVLAVSCLTNMAAGVSKAPLDHAAVLQTANASAQALADLVTRVLPTVAALAKGRP